MQMSARNTLLCSWRRWSSLWNNLNWSSLLSTLSLTLLHIQYQHDGHSHHYHHHQHHPFCYHHAMTGCVFRCPHRGEKFRAASGRLAQQAPVYSRRRGVFGRVPKLDCTTLGTLRLTKRHEGADWGSEKQRSARVSAMKWCQTFLHIEI